MKLDRRARADELYTSPWFSKARAYVTNLGAPWCVLSAKHGLLDPGTVIEPYEQTLNAMPIAGRKVWASRVLRHLQQLVAKGDDLVVLAGERYREFLIGPLSARGVRVHVPMNRMGLGEQLRWLDQHNPTPRIATR